MRIKTVWLLSTLLALYGCNTRHLRGFYKDSSDGNTYLVLVHDNGGACGPIRVDGKVWPYELGQKGLISAGVHTIECGGGLSFEIPEKVIFYFDYWGA